MGKLVDVTTGSNKDILTELLRSAGRGNRSTAIFDFLHGFNCLNPGTSSVDMNRDTDGYAFFTKPTLNLTYNNISLDPRLEFLTDKDPRSAGAAIRAMLSPVGWRGIPYDDNDKSRSSIVDDKCAFIPMMTNSLVAMGGWPDYNVETYKTKEGIGKESMSWVEGRPRLPGVYDLTLTFKNLNGDMLTQMLSAWWIYQGSVAEGSIKPFAEFLTWFAVDYQTRIYRFVMDESKTYITKMAIANAGFFPAVPIGSAFNFDATKYFITENDTISVPFQATVIIYNDPRIAKWFNTIGTIANPALANRHENMVKLSPIQKAEYNFRAYPYIEDDYELAWWVSKEVYENKGPQ